MIYIFIHDGVQTRVLKFIKLLVMFNQLAFWCVTVERHNFKWDKITAVSQWGGDDMV